MNAINMSLCWKAGTPAQCCSAAPTELPEGASTCLSKSEQVQHNWGAYLNLRLPCRCTERLTCEDPLGMTYGTNTGIRFLNYVSWDNACLLRDTFWHLRTSAEYFLPQIKTKPHQEEASWCQHTILVEISK